MSVRLNTVCWATLLLSGNGVWGTLDTRGQIDNLTFFLGDDTSPVLSDAGGLAYSIISATTLIFSRPRTLPQLWYRRDTYRGSCSTAGAISNCGEALLDFYNQSKKLSDLDAGDWQETAMDKSLCKAGLW